MVQSSADFEYQTDTVNTVSQGKTEFDTCDAKAIPLQLDIEPDSKTIVFHDEKSVGAPDEYVTVGTLLVFESRIIKEFRLLADKIDVMKSSFDEVKSMVSILESAQKETQSDLEQLQKHVTEEIPKQLEKTEEKIDRVESSMTALKTDVRNLHSKITQVKDSVLENCKSDFNVKIRGVNNTISDIKSSVAESKTNREDHKKKVETDIGNVTAIVQQKNQSEPTH